MDAKGYMGKTRVQALGCVGNIMATRSILCYRTKD